MSSTRRVGKPQVSGISNDQMGKNSSESSSPKVDQLTQSVADVNLESAQDGGEWEVYAKKSKNRAGSSSAKPWGAQSPKVWGHSDVSHKSGVYGNSGMGRASGKTWQTPALDSRRTAGRGSARPQARGSEVNFQAPQSVIRPPLEHGWNWQSRAGSNQSKPSEFDSGKGEIISKTQSSNGNEDKDNSIEDDDDDDDVLEDTDDDLLSDDFDSDASQKSHGTRKNSKWFKKFFDILDGLTVEEINEPARQWHCPACQGGPGAIDWYRGLQPLITHAKTKGSKRAKLHRELAELLDEELQRRGTNVVPSGEVYGQWKGLKEEEKDHEIVWPPMVVIMNTKLEQDETEKWVGMGNPELLDQFSSYAAVKARHSYGPQGHRGMSVLIFEASARGYLEAERLHKHLEEQGTDRRAWEQRHPVLFSAGGKRQLYGYMAVKEDLDSFNRHSQGKSKLKYEMKSYQEMVVKQIRQMSEDNQQLIYFKNKAAKERMGKEALQESLGIVCEKLRKTKEENRIVRQRTQMHHEESREEMHLQEQFFKDGIKNLHESTEAKEEDFERLQQERREKEKMKQSTAADPSDAEDFRRRALELSQFIEVQEKEVEKFTGERDGLVDGHEQKLLAMRQRRDMEMLAVGRKYWEEEMELERQFDEDLTRLMEKYSPGDASNGVDGPDGAHAGVA